MVRVNLGCGPDIKDGWHNVDSLDHGGNLVGDITRAIPITTGSADIILCNHVLEHIKFTDEKKVWDEIHRIMKKGCKLHVLVPNLIWLCEQIVSAEDKWSGFYEVTRDVTNPNYGFSSGVDYNVTHGPLMTHLYGNQIGDGQFHHNGYTEGKLRGIALKYNLTVESMNHSYHKSVKNIVAVLTKD